MRANFRLRFLACLMLGLACAMPAAGQAARVLATDPPDGGALNVGEALYVRLEYAGEQPLRFRVGAYSNGLEQSAGTRSNPAPTYPSGRGEALAWIELTRPATVDELRVEIYDASWALLEQAVLPFDIEWRAGGSTAARNRAAWVAPLSATQQQMTGAALAGDTEDDDFWMLLIMLAGWSIPGYFVLQTILYRRWRDGWRTAALLPLLGTVPIVAYTLFALFMGSNLWPLVMLFTLPLAFVYLVVLTLAKRVFSPT